MNQKEIVEFINGVLSTGYHSITQLTAIDIARVDLAMQIDASLRARMPSPDDPLRFWTLRSGDLFEIPNGEFGTHTKLALDDRVKIGKCWRNNCPPDDVWLNASLDGVLVHVCPDMLVQGRGRWIT